MLVKCISILLASTIFVDTSLMWFPRVKPEITAEPIITNIIEEVVVDEVSNIDYIVEEVAYEDTVEEVVEVDEPDIITESNSLSLSSEDINLIALVTMAEAEGESEEGKRLVIDVILNRYDSPRFSNTIAGVIYAKNAFECMWNGRINRCYVRDDIYQLVVEELQSRTNANVHYFRANRYHSFGTPVVQVGNHYFSTY